MAEITVQELGPNGAGLADITYTALSEATNTFDNDGQTILLIVNDTVATSRNCTVTSIPDPYGRTGDLVLSTIAGDGGTAMTGFLNTSLFGGTVSFTMSDATTVSVAAVRIRR